MGSWWGHPPWGSALGWGPRAGGRGERGGGEGGGGGGGGGGWVGGGVGVGGGGWGGGEKELWGQGVKLFKGHLKQTHSFYEDLSLLLLSIYIVLMFLSVFYVFNVILLFNQQCLWYIVVFGEAYLGHCCFETVGWAWA